MFEGLYNSASGMISQSFIQEIIAANIAKSVVPGYKKQTPVSESFETELSNYFKQVGGSKIKDIYTSFAQGNIKLTSNPLDVALTGGGFLVVENSTLEGSGNLYTRNGRLSINPDGVLVTLDGYPVLGEKGKISIKDATQDLTGPHEIIIDQNGTVSVRHNQTVEEIDTLRIVDFEEYNRLAPVGNSLFNSGGQEEGKSGNTVVNQGYIEESNVNILDEMVSMIANMRLYESNQKTLRTISESLQRSITEIGRV